MARLPPRTIRIEINRSQFTAVLALMVLAAATSELGSETLTMTTYYPAPVGIYNVLNTVGQTVLARDGAETPGNGNTVGIGWPNDPRYMLSVNGTINAKGFLKDGKAFSDFWEEKGGVMENTNPGPVTIKNNGVGGGIGTPVLTVDGAASGSGHALWISGSYQNEIFLTTPSGPGWELGLEDPNFFIIHNGAGASWGLNNSGDMFLGFEAARGRIVLKSTDGKCYGYTAQPGGALSAGVETACR